MAFTLVKNKVRASGTNPKPSELLPSELPSRLTNFLPVLRQRIGKYDQGYVLRIDSLDT